MSQILSIKFNPLKYQMGLGFLLSLFEKQQKYFFHFGSYVAFNSFKMSNIFKHSKVHPCLFAVLYYKQEHEIMLKSEQKPREILLFRYGDALHGDKCQKLHASPVSVAVDDYIIINMCTQFVFVVVSFCHFAPFLLR